MNLRKMEGGAGMPPVYVLIKPASSACNMACRYCFYRDVSDHREHSFEGMLTLQSMEKTIAAAMEFAEGSCTFGFQGGEPTLRGLDFFRQVIQIQKRLCKPGVQILNSIQTNGLCIDEEWAQFLSEHHFLVGLSMDGPGNLHDLNRVDRQGSGTADRVLHTAKLFDKYHVEYNILCVVTGKNAQNIGDIYRFFQKNNFEYLQFIPCLEPMDQVRGKESYHLSVDDYGEFLIHIFDLWFEDLKKGHYVSIRHIDNWIGILLGQRPEACSMNGRCSIQFVVEGDGSVYPCDFYVTDEWRLGNVSTETFAQMLRSPKAQSFIAASVPLPEECRTCPILNLCRNGCRRDRLMTSHGTLSKTYYCKAHQRFFTARRQQILQARSIILQMRQAYRPQ